MQDKSSGKRIMGMTPQNSIATMVASKPHALWAVPGNWTLAQGATVPVAYATAYDALVVRGRLQPHHRVLIHSATGAVGLAATRICLNRGCEVRLIPRPLIGELPARVSLKHGCHQVLIQILNQQTCLHKCQLSNVLPGAD